MNVIEQLEFELSYYDVPVQHVSHYTKETNVKDQYDILILYLWDRCTRKINNYLLLRMDVSIRCLYHMTFTEPNSRFRLPLNTFGSCQQMVKLIAHVLFLIKLVFYLIYLYPFNYRWNNVRMFLIFVIHFCIFKILLLLILNIWSSNTCTSVWRGP